MERGNNLCQVEIPGVGVDNDAIVAASLVEIRFLKLADLDRRIDQAIVVRRGELLAGKGRR